MKSIYKIILTTALFSISVFGQDSARLDGTVQDATGAVVAGAKITAVEKRTQISAQTTSSSSGNYTLPTLQPGIYTLSVEASGFRKSVVNDIELGVGATITQIIKMEIGQTSESVTVEANTVSVQTTEAQVSRVINMKEVDLLPQLNRSPIALAIFQPGVQIDVRAGQDASFSHINGLRQGSNNSTLDGIDVNDSLVPRLGLSLTANNTDSVEEFRVVTSGGKAEYGRSAGGQVELITRSGTNDIHGNAFDFLRNTDLNANDFFNNLSGSPVPQYIRNIYGFSVGGPIRKNKTFIFGNFQGTRTHQQTIRERTVPTASIRTGIYTYKDTSGNLQTYNIVGADPLHIGIDPAIAKLLALYPLPNAFDTGDGLNTAGYRFNNPTPSLEDQFTIKADHKLKDNHLLFLRWSWQRNTSIDGLNNADATFPGQPQGSQGGHRWGFSAGSTWTITPTLINEFRAGHQSATVDFLRPGRPNTLIPVVNSFTSIPYTSFTQGRNSPVNDFSDNVTKVRGNHTFKAGMSLRFTKQYGYNYAGIYENANTSATYATVPSSLTPAGLPANQLSTFQGLYNDLLGRIGYTTLTYYSNLTAYQQPGTPRVRNFLLNEGGYFVQDDWRINRKLSLNIGLRYDYYGVPHEQDSLQGTLTNAAQVNGVTQVDGLTIQKSTQWYNKDLNNFAPRFGFAYDVFGDGKTAIRGSYGIFYDRNVGAVVSAADGSTPGFSYGATAYSTGDVRYSSGNLPVPSTPSATPTLTLPDTRGSSIVLFNPNLRTGYVQNFNLSIQRSMPGQILLELGYVGNRGVKLFYNRDLNQPKISQEFVNSFTELQAYAGNTASPVSSSNLFVKVFGSPAAALSTVGASNVTQGNVGGIINNLDVQNYAKFQAAGYSQFYFRNYPQFNQAILGTNDGRSYYNSMQVSARRNTKNLHLNANFTWAKSIDNVSAEGNGFSTPIDNYNLKLNRALSDYDRPFSFNGTAVYTLPIGKGQRFGNNMPHVVDTLVGGWDVSALLIDQSGQPFSISSQRSTAPVSGSTPGNTYAQYNGTDYSIGSVQKTGSGVYFFTPAQIAQFTYPAAFQIGNSGRNVFRNPSFNEVDTTLSKSFRITERHKLQFRAEAYNLFNHPNFGLASGNLNLNTPASFGKFNTTLGTQVGGSSARTMQGVLRYEF